MTKKELISAKDAAVGAVLPLREQLLQFYGSVNSKLKSDRSVVTELDSWAEDEIKKSLKKFDSSIGFLGEEFGAEGNEHKRWLIDPIDGTEQFIRGIPFCGNMLCLVEGKKLLVSVIYNFVTDELYWAVDGGGAWLWDKRLMISNRTLDRSFVELSTDINTKFGLDLSIGLSEEVYGLTRFWCSCFSSCMVASGATEARVATTGKGGPWDYAPGVLLIVEAGGFVSHLDGSEYNYMNTGSLVMGTKVVHDFVLGLTRK